MSARIFVLDNYDSFTFNLVQYLGELGAEVEVARNDALRLEDVASRRPDGVLISPGPGVPARAGISVPLVGWCARRAVPLLGVCLGMQAIAAAYGGRIARARRVMHAKTSLVHHAASGVFAGLPNPFEAARYHSLVVVPAGLPAELRVTARTEDGVVMGLEHAELPVHGVQFHPESVLTGCGMSLLGNFLGLAALGAKGGGPV